MAYCINCGIWVDGFDSVCSEKCNSEYIEFLEKEEIKRAEASYTLTDCENIVGSRDNEGNTKYLYCKKGHERCCSVCPDYRSIHDVSYVP